MRLHIVQADKIHSTQFQDDQWTLHFAFAH